MINLTKIELYKLFMRKRTYIGFIAILLIVLIAQAAMLWEGQAMHEFLTSNLNRAFIMQGNLVNGYLMTFLVLNFLWVHVPLLIVIVTGDLISGESHGGTFRLLVTRPISRWKLISAKYIAATVYTFLIMIFFAVISLVLGILLFGKGDLMVIFNAVAILPEDDILWRFILAYIFGFISMTSVAALSLVLSSFANNSLGPIITTMAIIILFTMISTFDLQVFSVIKPFLLTTYLDSWQLLFEYDVNLITILKDSIILIVHILLFYGLTIWHFGKKDILT